MERPLRRGTPMLRKIKDHREANSAHEGPQNNRSEHPPVIVIGAEAATENHKTSVIENRNCHEHCVEERFHKCVVAKSDEAWEEGEGQNDLRA